MLRYQIFLSFGVCFLSFWLALIKNETRSPLIIYSPILLVGLLGIYAVGSISLGLMSFMDAPEAAAEIERQITEAKAEMKKRGVLKSK